MENRELDLSFTDSNSVDSSLGQTSARPYFSTAGRQGLIEQLIHILQFGEGLPVLVGAPGAGKSAVLAELFRQLDDSAGCTLCELTDLAPPAQSLAFIGEALGLDIQPEANIGEVLAMLRHYCEALSSEQKKVVLLLDNAHLMDDASLAAMVSLLQAHDASGYGLGLLMAARPGVVERLDALTLLDVPIYDFEIPLFSASELEGFIATAGLSENLEHHRGDVNSLWAKSLGNPSVVLSLLEASNSQLGVKSSAGGSPSLGLKSVISGLPIGHLVAMCVLISVLAWAVLTRQGSDVSEPVTSIVQPRFDPDGSAASVSGSKSVVIPDVVKSTALAEPKATDLKVMELDLPDRPVALDTMEVVETVEPQAPDAPLEPKPVVLPTPSPAPQLPTGEVRPSVAATPAVNISAEKKASAVKTASSVETDEKFLLARPDSEYTLQVLAASKQRSLRAYIKRQSNRDRLYLYQGVREGRKYYVVLAGLYPSRQAALQARHSLPKEQSSAGPWPRALRDIKHEIIDNRNK